MEKINKTKNDPFKEKKGHNMWTERSMTLCRKRFLKRETVISQE